MCIRINPVNHFLPLDGKYVMIHNIFQTKYKRIKTVVKIGCYKLFKVFKQTKDDIQTFI